jgi:hypothetical protein
MTFLYVGAFDDLSIKILNEILESNKGINKLILIKLKSISLDLISFDDIISYNYENLILADYSSYENQINFDEYNFIHNDFFQISKMMDRLHKVYSYSFDDRYEMYLSHLKGLSNIISLNNPDYSLFTNMPHEVFDYILYKLLKYRNIKTKFLLHGMQMENYFQILDDISENDTRLGDYNECSSELQNNLLKIIYEKNKDLNHVQFYLKDDFRPINRLKKSIFNFFKIKYEFLKVLKSNYFYKYIVKIVVDQIEILSTKKVVKALITEEIDYYKKIIFVPLNYQPELSTSPMGGKFFEQRFMIELLSANCPEGYQILVKDHPKQGLNFGRNKSFYTSISKLNNVSLIDPNTNNDLILKKSDLVAVATGTLGFQALCNGKKVLVFGNPFFKFFKEGAFPIKNEIDLIIFFKNFNSNKSFDRKQLFKFLNRCDEIFNYGFIDKDYMRFSSYSIDKNAEIVAKAVLKELF